MKQQNRNGFQRWVGICFEKDENVHLQILQTFLYKFVCLLISKWVTLRISLAPGLYQTFYILLFFDGFISDCSERSFIKRNKTRVIRTAPVSEMALLVL